MRDRERDRERLLDVVITRAFTQPNQNILKNILLVQMNTGFDKYSKVEAHDVKEVSLDTQIQALC